MLFILTEKHEKLLFSTYSKILSKALDVEVIHKNKYIAAKVKSYINKYKTDFLDERLPREQTPY